MDSKINDITRLIELKKEKYPNISNIWLTYLEKRIEILKESLEKAEKIFTEIETNINQDIPYSTIAILIFLNQELLP